MSGSSPDGAHPRPAPRIHYLLTTPAPIIPGSDAVVQEVEALRASFGGHVTWLRPSWRARARYPRLLLGLHRLAAIRQWDRQVDLHHVYAPELYVLPLLWFVERPVVYTATAGLDGGRLPPTSFLRRLGAIVVPTCADLDRLTRLGLRNIHRIRPGIDLTRFVERPVPPGPEFVLLSGSAPWTRGQFRTKGVDVLLQVAREMPDLRLVFLWRGVHLPDLLSRVRRLGLVERVQILHQWVDVSETLAGVHAAVVLAERPGLVKAYPHSLLEAMATGRPVLVSEGTAMARFVQRTGCGRVISRLEKNVLVEAIRQLRANYETCRARALDVGRRDLSQSEMIAAHRALYHALTR
jgi:glycosyltransferase involved in cell wall biosynthesis